MSEREGIYEQFLIDAPRISIWIDGKLQAATDPVSLFFDIFERCSS